jgi:sugar lactone lactonase YvrE
MLRHAFALIVGLFAIVVYGVQSPAHVQADINTTEIEVQSATPVFPDLIPLPTTFGPEGIAVGNGPTFYVGSLSPASLGQILAGDLLTGHVFELVPPTGRPALGMKHDSRSNLLFVAGGTSGRATVYHASSGEQVGFYQFQPPSPPPPAARTTNINDVVVTQDAAYFTDAVMAFLYRVPLGPQGEPSEEFERIPLPPNFGVLGGCAPPVTPGRGNGIAAAPSGSDLIVVHTSEGQLYRIDTATYAVVPILTGGDVCSGDGVLLDGTTLYVVQNLRNQIAVVELSPDHFSGTITRYITEPFASNPATQVPTAVAEFGNSLYAVTAGFAPPAPDFVVRLSK